MNDLEMRKKSLDDLMGEMETEEFEKKLKPLLTITISAGESAETPEVETEEMEEDDLDPRLAKIMQSKG